MIVSMPTTLFPPFLRLLALLAGLFLLLFTALPVRAAVPKLVLSGPSAVVSFPLVVMVEKGMLAGQADEVGFRHWQTPDQLRVLLVQKEVDYSATPVNLPAILASKGAQVRLLNVSVWGLLWLVSRDPDIRTVDDLAGQPLVSTYQRDLPSLLLDRLLAARGMTGSKAPDIRYARTTQDAITLLLSGKADSAMLAEPSVSLLLAQAAAKGVPLHRVASLEALWKESFPANPLLPQAGIMANSTVAANRALGQAVTRAYHEAACWCVAQVDECAALVHKQLDFMPVPAIATAIRATRLESVTAAASRPALESLYRLLLEHNPQAVGGKLPAGDFYGP